MGVRLWGQFLWIIWYIFSCPSGSNYHTFGDYLIQLSLSGKQFFFCDDKIDVKSIGYGGYGYELSSFHVGVQNCKDFA